MGLRDAPSQRAQGVALKLLGQVIFESCDEASKSKKARALQRIAEVPETHDLSEVDLAAAVLSAFLFDNPTASFGLLSIALRSILRCRALNVPVLEREICNFLCSLDDWSFTPLRKAAARASALAVITSDVSSKTWVTSDASRMCAGLHLVCHISEHFLASLSPSGKFHETLDVTALSLDRNLLQSACESSMKIAQDILNSLYTSSAHKTIANAMGDSKMYSLVLRTRDTCHRLLSTSLPRNCSLPCAMSYVTGIALTSRSYTDATCIEAVLREKVLSKLSQYSPFSQLALLRAVMEIPVPECAQEALLFPCAMNASDALTVFTSLVSLSSTSSDVHFRFLAMETTISCLRHASESGISESCRDAVVNLIFQRWEEPFAGVTSQIRETVQVLVDINSRQTGSAQFWGNMTKSLVHGDWSSRGMYAPLSVLVHTVGALKILTMQPDCQLLSMHAAARDSRLTKAVADWLSCFWDVLFTDCNNDWCQFASISTTPLVSALISDDVASLRERIAEHILPVFLKCQKKGDTRCRVQVLLDCLRNRCEGRGNAIWGTIAILSTARRSGVLLQSFVDPDTRSLISAALSSDDEDLRSTAFELVVSTTVPTEPISKPELDMISTHLPIALMPGGSPACRSRYRQNVRRFFERFAACERAALEGTGGWWGRQRKRCDYEGGTDVEEDRQSLLKLLSSFETACTQLLLASTYPGAAFERRTCALEFLLLSISNLGSPELICRRKSYEAVNSIDVLCTVVDDWERPRRAGFEMVKASQGSLSYVKGLSQAESVLRFALPLLDSPRQSDVDSAALLCRTLFQKFVLNQSNSSKRTTEGDSHLLRASCLQLKAVSGGDEFALSPVLVYAESILESLEDLLSLAEVSFDDACRHGLFHSRFLLMRYVISDFPWATHSSPSLRDATLSFVGRFLSLARRCAQIALNGISYRRFSELEKEDPAEDNDEFDVCHEATVLVDESRQLESTSCFLSVKEICVSIGVLFNQLPTGGSNASINSPCITLNFNQVEEAGRLFSLVFCSTRHWGVIDGASEGLQLMCERFLSAAQSNVRNFPHEWVSKIVSSALNAELYVLRRSAGIPYAVLAVVNAESSVNRRSYESPLLDSIMKSLLEHVDGHSKSQKSNDSVSHALNLLRSLFLNSAISGNVMKHLERAVIACVNSFSSTSWLVRNSGMMLYSSLIRRGIGVCRESQPRLSVSSFKACGGTSATLDGERRLKGTTAFQFFSRHPALHPFFLEELERAISSHDSTSKNPTLYPILYLLSCLSPRLSQDPTACISMHPFWEVVRKCSRSPSEYIRRAAAAASVPLITEYSRIPMIARTIFETGIPSRPQHVSLRALPKGLATDNGNEHEPRQIFTKTVHLNQNGLHGDLLTLERIMKNAHEMLRRQDKRKVLYELGRLLPTRTWIAIDEVRNPCSVTRAGMLDLLSASHMLAVDVVTDNDAAEEAHSVLALCRTIANQLVQLSTTCEIDGTDFGEVAACTLHAKARKLLAQVLIFDVHIGTCEIDSALRSIAKCIDNGVKDGLVIALDACCQILNSSGASRATNTDVFFDVWQRVEVNCFRSSDAEILTGALSCMSALVDYGHRHKHTVWDTYSFSEFISELFNLAESHNCVDVQEHAVLLLGRVMHIRRGEDAALRWIALIRRAQLSPASSLRKAVCSSLLHYGFRRTKGTAVLVTNTNGEVNAHIVLVLASLLEDDSADVRMECSRAAYKCLDLAHNDGEVGAAHDILSTLLKLFEFLSIHLGGCHAPRQYLIRLLAYGDESDAFCTALDGMLGKPSWAPLSFPREPAAQVDNIADSRSCELFKMESACNDGEVVLQMQLVCLCFARVIERIDFVPPDVHMCLRVACEESGRQLRETVERCTRTSNRGPLSRLVYSEDGFVDCLRCVHRVFLLMRCLSKLRILCDSSDLVDCQQSVVDCVARTAAEYEDKQHSVLQRAISSLVSMGRERVQLQLVPVDLFFLLPQQLYRI